MTQPKFHEPERAITSSTRCDRTIPGDGMMSYHCTLPQGHERETSDPEDPQPCYVLESRRARSAWSDWKQRELDRAQIKVVQEAQTVIGCPACGNHTMHVNWSNQTASCHSCGEQASFASTPGDTASAEEIAADIPPIEERRILKHTGEPPEMTSTASTPDPEIMAAAQQAAEDPDALPPMDAPEPEPGYASQMVAAGLGERRIPGKGDGTSDLDLPQPTKQREGDQILPAGGDRVVQDEIMGRVDMWVTEGKISPEDAGLIRTIYIESKRVGLERYGQYLKTFDGRFNIRDLADELRDALVYVTKLQMTAEADKETLVRLVTEAIDREFISGGEVDTRAFYAEAIAQVAVDRILDWVLAQKIGPDQIRPA